jgi:hypothetical protein
MSFHKNGNAIIEQKQKKAEIFLSRNNVDQSELFLGKGNTYFCYSKFLSLTVTSRRLDRYDSNYPDSPFNGCRWLYVEKKKINTVHVISA